MAKGKRKQRAAETRAMPYGGPLDYRAASSAPSASTHAAENLSTVLACVGVLSSALASLPALVFQRGEGGRKEVTNHPVAALLRRPNDHQTWPDWLEWTMAQVLLYGNALSIVEYDASGAVTGLTPVPWRNVSAMLLPNGKLVFDVVAYNSPWGRTMPRRLLSSEVFHLKDRSDDGLLGRSRISRAPDVLSNALALQHWSGSMWQNGATPSGALTLAGRPDEPTMRALRTQLEQRYSGTDNARRVLLLTDGATWQQISVSPEDAEVLASRRFTVEELCRLFQVPPPLVQDYSHGTFTNSAQAGLWFGQFSLAPWARKIEAEFSRSVFTADDHELEIDLSGLMRGDYAERWRAHEIAVKNNILDANEVREVEGWNRRA